MVGAEGFDAYCSQLKKELAKMIDHMILYGCLPPKKSKRRQTW